MKWFNTIVIASLSVASIFISCDEEEKTEVATPPAQELQDVTNAIDQIVESHGFSETNDVVDIINGTWHCDVLVKYTLEWVSEIIYNFGGEPWTENFEPMLEFISNGNLNRYTISPETNRVVYTRGEWSFDTGSRTLSIGAEAIEQYDAMVIDAELLALADDVMVIKWTDQNQDVWCAVYRKYEGLLWSIEADILINAALDEFGNYDPTTIEQSIVGKWSGNTFVEYDSEWQHVTSPMVVFGIPYADGVSLGVYSFNEDGTFNLFVKAAYPLDEDRSYDGIWSFNPDSRKLNIEAEGFNREYTIVGYGEEMILADYVYGDRNYRDGLVRINN